MSSKIYGKRAVELINKRCAVMNRTLTSVLAEVCVPYSTFRCWEKGRYNPSAYALECMALARYDIYYILTGVKSNGK